ncbi:MAG: tRNA1(Val) (adenine(37)-N6)-methyltransferase [Chitinophagaceae bacterium]
MANNFFQFKQFIIHQDRCAMKVTTDSCLFGAWAAEKICLSSSPGSKPEVRTILDIGAGTGLLSLMIAQQCNATIDAIEVDKETYEQAIENIEASPWANRINITHSDANEFFNAVQYDVIVSNPPFYENELKSGNTKKNKAHHDEGLQLNDLLTIIHRNLKPGGKFYLLLPFKRNDEIENAFVKKKLSISHKTLVRQTTQHPYIRIMISGKHQTEINVNVIITELTLKNEENEYTPGFIRLLKDYYLYL